MDMITLSNVQKSYGSHQVLNDVSLNVRKGEIYGLIGKTVPVKQQFLKLSSDLQNMNRADLVLPEANLKKIYCRREEK